MFTTWDKALVPFVLSVIGLAVYAGLIPQEKAQSLGAVVVPAVVAAAQAIVTWIVPNKA